jgi:hypothetical protein
MGTSCPPGVSLKKTKPNTAWIVGNEYGVDIIGKLRTKQSD